ncbi:sensor histidine kinase [Teichococcus vastitatis]|jgi:two-component system osmolarity sensor histidine kinase EnvZ|nr:HAMP domain-containing sensor histidine kinase [Pseudoroseomonas vastitatis]
MIARLWMRDTITRRFILTIFLVLAATVAMNGAFVALSGVWGRPSFEKSGLPEAAAATVRIIEAQPPEQRAVLARSAGTRLYNVAWHPMPLVEPTAALRDGYIAGRDRLRALLEDPSRTILFLHSGHPAIEAGVLAEDFTRRGQLYFVSVALPDRSWITFSAAERSWGIATPLRGVLIVLFAIASILGFSAAAACSLASPVAQLARAVHRFGVDPRAPDIPLSGPVEVRETIVAFNAMQGQIRRFVEDRTTMLAAISHDLRTPLTRMRLRAEFIGDPVQQQKLFRDVDEMRSMVDSALSFFRDDAGQEPATSFDLPELIKTIIDDYGDQGTRIDYMGPRHARWTGRPRALRRVFENLIENALKHATPPAIALRITDLGAELTVCDRGPGVDPDKLEQVFLPFHRLSKARNPSTGGMGLGLTSARSIIRAHGGDLTLRNLTGGGLEAIVALPRMSFEEA